MSESKKPDHERARRLVAALNEAANTHGECLGHDSWGCGYSTRLRYCEREEQVCHCCDRHACEGATK